MTDHLDLGLHFIIGLSGTKLSDLDKEILETVRPAGILLLKRNFLHGAPYPEWLSELDSLYSSVMSYSGRDKMLITIDHEGGRVHRTPPPITHFPSAVTYASKAYEIAKAMAVELRSIGVNISWSPCADIHSNPSNPVIGDRSFGENPHEVAENASAFARGLMEEGVLACAKHFPGHGDTSVDSHLSLPTLSLSYDELRLRELIPFNRLVGEGIPFVMTSHILFPDIDPQNPATFSKVLLNNLLKRELGFGGLVVTDDLDMKAVAESYTSEGLVAKAVGAGCDLFIVARYPDGASTKPLEMHRGLSNAITSGEIEESLISESSEKIRYLIAHALMKPNVHELPPSVFEAHSKLI